MYKGTMEEKYNDLIVALSFLAERKDLQGNDVRVALECVYKPISQTELCKRLGMKKQNVNKSIKKLMAKNIVLQKIYDIPDVTYFCTLYSFNLDVSAWQLEFLTV